VILAGMLLVLSASCFAQTNVLSVTVPPDKFNAKSGATAQMKLAVKLRPGYHCNSNTPSDQYLIPLRLTWEAGPLQVAEVVYPKPQMEKFSFSKTPISVFTNDFEILTRFKVPANAVIGPAILSGKLRYQACNDRMCLAPKTVDVLVPVDIVK
jgi:hypothetical protein